MGDCLDFNDGDRKVCHQLTAMSEETTTQQPKVLTPVSVNPASEPKPAAPAPGVREVNGFKIESGVPIPERVIGAKRSPLRYVLEAMKQGDSIVVSDKDAGRLTNIASDLKIKLARRKQEDGSYRVWHNGPKDGQ